MTTVILDPGHGGATATGASTPYGSTAFDGRREKDLTLALARRVAAHLPGSRLTRDGDHNPSLGDRIRHARDGGADVFLSLHADRSPGAVMVHDGGGSSSRALAEHVSSSLSLGNPMRAELAVLHPAWHHPRTAACLVDLDPDRLAALDPNGTERLAQRIAGAVLRYGQGTSPLFDGGLWSFPATDGTILLWHGYSGTARDSSTEQVARTLGYALMMHAAADRLGNVSLKLVKGWDKSDFFAALAKEEDHTVIQVHYVGHGDTGGMYCGYHEPTAQSSRGALAASLATKKAAGTSVADLRLEALEGEPSFCTGLLEIDKYRDALQSKLHPNAFWQIWGCYAGGPTHQFDTTDAYWDLLNTSSAGGDSISAHLAKVLGIPVVASKGKGGNEFWYRHKGRVRQDDPSKRIYRPAGIPQWLWPHAKATWVTREKSTAKEIHSEKGGTPAVGLTDMDKRDTSSSQTWP